MRRLASIGVFILTTTVSLLLLGLLCIPTFRAPKAEEQMFSIRFQDLRNENGLHLFPYSHPE